MARKVDESLQYFIFAPCNPTSLPGGGERNFFIAAAFEKVEDKKAMMHRITTAMMLLGMGVLCARRSAQTQHAPAR